MTQIATVTDARKRADIIRMGMVAYSDTLRTIAAAYAARDWEALGHADWDAYVNAEFGETRLRLSSEQRAQAVAALRIEGMSQRAIGTALGISQPTVQRDLSGDSNESPEAPIRGIDGKSYAPTQPTRTEPDPSTGATAEIEPEPMPVEMPAGQDIGDAVLDAFDKRAAPTWSAEEELIRKQLESGETVVVSLRPNHANVAAWSEAEGLFVRIDRRSEWGNPFELPGDGDRDTVIASYETHYLPYKPSLLGKVEQLRGKALGCWCAPEPCHGDVLKARAES